MQKLNTYSVLCVYGVKFFGGHSSQYNYKHSLLLGYVLLSLLLGLSILDKHENIPWNVNHENIVKEEMESQ